MWKSGKPIQFACNRLHEPKMEKLYIVSKNKTRSWLWLRSQLLLPKFRLKLKKVEKTTRPFRYDLNKIPYDSTVEVRNRFKGLDLIDRMPDEQWMKAHDSVITHLGPEPDILGCEVKWALGNITTNKASGGDGIPAKLFQLLKDDAQYTSKFGKLSSGHRTGKGQFSFQSQRKAMPKNVQVTAQLYSSHMLAK